MCMNSVTNILCVCEHVYVENCDWYVRMNDDVQAYNVTIAASHSSFNFQPTHVNIIIIFHI